VSGKAGANRLTFTRRFAGKTLAVGSYRLVLLATGGATRRILFKVVG
jgi:hypothetical protein